MADITDDLLALRILANDFDGPNPGVAGIFRRVVDECERLQRDAERYAWLRDKADTPAICESDDDGWYPLIGAAIEAAVDKAMQEQPR